MTPLSGEVEPLWKPSSKTIETWKRQVPTLDPKVTFENGHMFIYDFGPHDRQAFAGAVMRFVHAHMQSLFMLKQIVWIYSKELRFVRNRWN